MIKVDIKPLSVNEAYTITPSGRYIKTAKCEKYHRDLYFLLPR
ncbi:unnamed protein product, partial [marine sediment metagenome]